jgi:hypothetical protein
MEVIPIDLADFEMWGFRLRVVEESLKFINDPGVNSRDFLALG